MKKLVKPFYNPISLPINQIRMIFSFTKLTSWKKLSSWAIQSPKLFTTAAGSTGISCFGYPSHPVFEITNNCNLTCNGCHANGGEDIYKEMDTNQAKQFIRELAEIKEFKTLIFTGGEPFLRTDLYELIDYSKKIGFYPIIASNATLMPDETIKSIKKLGVTGVAVSIDSINPEKHDKLRGLNGCYEEVMNTIERLKKNGLYVQTNLTISKNNVDELEELIMHSDRVNSHVILLYQFITTGRGKDKDDVSLNSQEFLELIKKTVVLQKSIKPVIAPIGLPEYWAYLFSQKKNISKRERKFFPGCIAGKGMFYIKPNGDVWPCAFLPVVAGNVFKEKPIDIWEKSEVYINLRNRNNLKGICKNCEYIDICGGCRARAYAISGDYLGEDPICPIYKKN
jgi:AdoMet-dependent heme synthase